MADKETAIGRIRPVVAKIVDNRAASQLRQWQEIDTSALAANAHSALVPSYVFETQSGDLGRSQSQINKTPSDRIVSPSRRGATVEGAEKPRQFLGR